MKKWLAVLLAALLWGTVAWAPGGLSLSVSMAQPARQGAPQSADFDHLRTGFPLTDRHAQARCESCHQNGIFQGTPRDCASCHRAGMRLARGVNDLFRIAGHVAHNEIELGNAEFEGHKHT